MTSLPGHPVLVAGPCKAQLCCLLLGTMKLSISLYLVSLFSLTSFDGFLFPEIKGLD